MGGWFEGFKHSQTRMFIGGIRAVGWIRWMEVRDRTTCTTTTVASKNDQTMNITMNINRVSGMQFGGRAAVRAAYLCSCPSVRVVNASFYGSSKIDRLETVKGYKKFRLKYRSY